MNNSQRKYKKKITRKYVEFNTENIYDMQALAIANNINFSSSVKKWLKTLQQTLD